MWERNVEWGRPQMTRWRMGVVCRVPKATNTHTLGLCNTHCLSAATVVVRTCLNVTLYVRRLSGEYMRKTAGRAAGTDC